jgi:hypothetical protein
MNRTSSLYPSSRRRPVAPLAQRVQSSIARAKTLVQDGYRLLPSEARPLTYCVYKPGQQAGYDKPTYHVVLWHDADLGEPLERAGWRYRCDCHLYREQERLQQRGELDSFQDYCACKHGERALSEFLRLLTDTAAILGYCPYPPPSTPNRFTTALTRVPVAADPDPAHPWPTHRATMRPAEDFD